MWFIDFCDHEYNAYLILRFNSQFSWKVGIAGSVTALICMSMH